jgi:glycosyltransferase involved in cell wall biosynthesis
MKVGIVVTKPMHFDAPFFRFVASSSEDELRVVYTDADKLTDQFFDYEIGTNLSWGLDLFNGYPFAVMPKHDRWRWMRAHLHSSRYDMLIVSGYRTHAVRLALLAAAASRTPLSLRLDSALFNNTSRTKLAAKASLFLALRGVCNHFFAVSGSTVALLRRLGVQEERITRYPYTVDLNWFAEQSHQARSRRTETREHYGLPADPTPVILSITKFTSRESPWDLLDAFDRMKEVNASLWLIGDGPDRAALEARARSCGGGRVIFSGYVPFRSLPDAYAASDVFVHPARSEPWGVSVEEALASGLPVVGSSRVGAALDLVVDGKNGYIYQTGDSAELRRQLQTVLFKGDSVQARQVSDRVLSDYAYSVIWRDVVGVAAAVSRSR